MMPHHVAGVLQPAHALDDRLAQFRVAVHHPAFIGGQAGRLEDDIVADTDLADIVQERALDQRLNLLALQLHHFGRDDSEERHPQIMVAVSRVALGDRLAERPEHLEVPRQQGLLGPGGQPPDHRVQVARRPDPDRALRFGGLLLISHNRAAEPLLELLDHQLRDRVAVIVDRDFVGLLGQQGDDFAGDQLPDAGVFETSFQPVLDFLIQHRDIRYGHREGSGISQATVLLSNTS